MNKWINGYMMNEQMDKWYMMNEQMDKWVDKLNR